MSDTKKMKPPKTPSESEALIQRMRREVEIRKGILETSANADFSLPRRGKKNEPFLKKAAAALERVRGKLEAVKKLPNFLRSFRRNQAVIDQGLLESIQHVACEVERLQKLVLALDPRNEELLHHNAVVLEEQKKHTHTLEGKVAVLANSLHVIEQRLSSPKELGSEAGSQPGDSARGDLEALRIDTFYLAFEGEFRGNRELITKRLKHYSPWLEAVKTRLPEPTAVDIGCGRGEWLELLKEHEIAARGVDINARMAAHCQGLGLEVECGDGIAYLRSLPADSQAIVSGFHIVEHLPLGLLLELIQQAHRVLRPGGIAIFETPNPEAQRVSTYTFFLDPTHRNPIPNELLCFAGSHAGFSDTHVERVQPAIQENGRVDYLDYAGIFMK